ncbi:hypothetical protein, partial [Streptococcus agalactiae]|uniref:hypothetical protein n=1 Tax=Streptococcus agalactiae TaxID=1311 RepID=UPI001F47DEAF
ELVDATLGPTMLDAQKVLAPPFGTGWRYAEPGWPKPGHQGASILVGHINHRGAPVVDVAHEDAGALVTRLGPAGLGVPPPGAEGGSQHLLRVQHRRAEGGVDEL